MKRALKLLLALCLCLCLTTCAFPEEPPAPDYLGIMVRSARFGEVEKGRKAEYMRNALIDTGKLDEAKVSFDDLFLLSKFIQSQAGSIWVTEEFRLCMGEVVMNRVASPDFPDDIAGVIYQDGQYDGVHNEEFQCHLLPSQCCVDAALRLLLGERMMSENVLYASGEQKGEVYALYSDARIGYTYFCLGENTNEDEQQKNT